jgi:hypothetical protein
MKATLLETLVRGTPRLPASYKLNHDGSYLERLCKHEVHNHLTLLVRLTTFTISVNNATDFWSALLFLKITGGIQEKNIFNAKIARPLEGIVKDNNQARLKIRGEAQALFQWLVNDLCLRRKKDMKFINLKMAEKTEYVHRVRFTKLEQLRYEKMLCVLGCPFYVCYSANNYLALKLAKFCSSFFRDLTVEGPRDVIGLLAKLAGKK